MKTALIGLMQLCAAMAFCQTASYTAKVVDSENRPIPFAAVSELGTNNYTTADDGGIFTLKRKRPILHLASHP